MRYIFDRKTYLIQENSTWLDKKKETWDQDFHSLIGPFHDRIIDLIGKLKDEFNDKDDPIEVMRVYNEYIELAFDSLIDSVRNITDKQLLHKLWNELSFNFKLWKEDFKKMSEEMDNYNSIFKLGYEVFSRIILYNTKKIFNDYHSNLKGKLDDRRESVIKFLEDTQREIISRLIDINANDIFSMTNLGDRKIEDIVLDAGDEVRYYQIDGEENIAIISHNQESLTEVNNVRLVSKNDGSQFEISKSNLIEIIPRHKTINQEVGDKLNKIKSDPERLNKLNDFLNTLTDDVD